MAINYNGFNTIGQQKKFRLSDFELVKRDLQNHFAIRQGEKLMQPEFGSIIWSMLYEPLTVETKAVIAADVQRIVNYDPRLNVTSVLINDFDHGLQVQIGLTYIPLNQAEVMLLNFNKSTNTLSAA